MIDLNKLGEKTYRNCIERNRIKKYMSHSQCAEGIGKEFVEFIGADEMRSSEHLPEYTEAEEELADLLICCMTELHRRGVDVEDIINKKIAFNENRTR